MSGPGFRARSLELELKLNLFPSPANHRQFLSLEFLEKKNFFIVASKFLTAEK